MKLYEVKQIILLETAVKAKMLTLCYLLSLPYRGDGWTVIYQIIHGRPD